MFLGAEVKIAFGSANAVELKPDPLLFIQKWRMFLTY
jgi:hypothetical protein